MFPFGKNPDQKKSKKPPFNDIDGLPLHEGDFVESLRYELGICKILKTSEGYVYESVETGKQVHWSRMVDAHLKNQKVIKITGEGTDSNKKKQSENKP